MKYSRSHTFGLTNLLVVMLSLTLIAAAQPGWAEDEHDHDHDAETPVAAAVDPHAGHDHEEEGAEVHLTAEQMAEFGIRTAIAGPGELETHVSVPGEVVVNNDRLAHIAPRFAGVVKEVRKRLGDTVTRGEVLAVVESNDGLTPYNVTSMLDGTVIEKHITIGENYTEDKPAFVIADLDTVWINLSIYQTDLPLVKVGQKVSLSAGKEIPETSGVISYISPVVDEHTRTATARVVIANVLGNWRPGLFVNGTIAVDRRHCPVLIPRTALQQIDDEMVVFVKGEDAFEPHHVTVGKTNAALVEIVAGLAVGETYVSEGGFILKAELGKGEFGHGHGH